MKPKRYVVNQILHAWKDDYWNHWHSSHRLGEAIKKYLRKNSFWSALMSVATRVRPSVRSLTHDGGAELEWWTKNVAALADISSVLLDKVPGFYVALPDDSPVFEKMIKLPIIKTNIVKQVLQSSFRSSRCKSNWVFCLNLSRPKSIFAFNTSS
jgi:hypothetical protein